MTAATLPATQPGSPGVDDPIHAVCCDPDLALCGEDLTGADTVPTLPLDEACPTCLIADQINGPCASPTCPHRKDQQ